MQQEQATRPRSPSIRRTRWSAAGATCTATRSSIPAPASSRGCPFVYSYEALGAHLRRLHAEGLRRRDRPRHAAGGRAARRPASARSARCASRCRCASAEIEQTYASRGEETGCVNPEFGELPVGAADVPRLRAAQGRLSQRAPSERVLAPAPDGARGEPEERDQERRAARRARARRPRRSRSSGTRRRARGAGRSSVGFGAAAAWRGRQLQLDGRVAAPRGSSRRARAGAARPARVSGAICASPRRSAAARAARASCRWRRAIVRVGRVDPRLEVLDRDVRADDRAERAEPRDRLLDVAPRHLRTT